MLAEVLETSSVQRLRGILKSRYGKGLKVNFMVDATSIDLTAQSPCFKQGDLRIPIIANGKFFATAIVPNSTNLSAESVTQVSELVQLVLAPALLDWHLKQNELNATPANNDEGSPFPGMPINAPGFLLESKSKQMISKVAIQIHEITERWASLRYADIKATLLNIQDIKELGALTIVIEDIHSLSTQEQALIAEYMVQADLKTEPLFLIGTSMPFHELLAKGQMITAFAKLLQDNRLELDRLPQNFKLLKESLELVLDRKALLN